MNIIPKLDKKLKEPLYIQLYQYFKEEIQSGRIPSCKRLPSIRQLAGDLHISKTTIQWAYQQLLAEGYIENKERSGYYVVEMESMPFGHTFSLPKQPRSEKNPFRKGSDVLYDFYMSHIDADHFPFQKWRTCLNQTMLSNPKELLFYGDRRGEPDLRAAISSYLRQSRAVNCMADQLVLGAGTQTIVRLLCHLIGCDGKKVAMEEPGYEGVRHVFQQLGFQVIPIPLEEDGLSVDELHKSGAKVVYITPSHQFPLGMVMPVAKRMRLLKWAKEIGGLIIEDDYDSEFRYHGKPIPSLQGLDVNGNVVYVGTFSKSLMPAVRMSYAVLPHRLLNMYQHHDHGYDQTVSRLHQKTLQLFMESGEWERHLRRMKKVYQRKHDILLQTIHHVMNGHVQITGQNAGLHVVMKINSPKSADDLVHIAEKSGVRVYGVVNKWMNIQKKDEPLILLGFGGLSIKEIPEGIERLHEAWLPFYK